MANVFEPQIFPETSLRKLEFWEKGFNIIVKKRYGLVTLPFAVELAGLLNSEAEDLLKILNSDKFLPLSRVESVLEAEKIVGRLAAESIVSQIIGDEELQPETPVRRLRRIEFSAEKLVLILFNNDEVVEIPRENLILTVSGVIFERKLESTESIKRREKGKVLSLNEVGSDELVMDIYSRGDALGYRINQRGFDFSGLGDRKGLIAGENIKILGEKLREFSPTAVFDDDYLKVRAELSKIWEVQENIHAGSVDRKSFGSFKRTKTITVNNLSQFARYSRLQRKML